MKHLGSVGARIDRARIQRSFRAFRHGDIRKAPIFPIERYPLGRRIQQHSAGGVVVKRDAAGLTLLVIRPRGRDRWQLPKGNVDPGETPENAALREVREEGGVVASLITHLAPTTFFYQMQGQKFVKTVDFYLMSFASGSPDNHDEEVDDSRWLPVEQGLRVLTFESERNVVRMAIGYLSGSSVSVA